MDVLKPLVLLACVAFAVGFLGFLGLAEIARGAATETAWAYPDTSPSSATVSAPLVATPDNPGKRI